MPDPKGSTAISFPGPHPELVTYHIFLQEDQGEHAKFPVLRRKKIRKYRNILVPIPRTRIRNSIRISSRTAYASSSSDEDIIKKINNLS